MNCAQAARRVRGGGPRSLLSSPGGKKISQPSKKCKTCLFWGLRAVTYCRGQLPDAPCGLRVRIGHHQRLLTLDCPTHVSVAENVSQQADELLLVTTPEPPAMMDAYALLKAVTASRAGSIGQVRLIVNMVGHRRDAEHVHARMADVARKFLGIRVGLLGYVFCDGHVGRAVQRQEPLMVSCPHSQAAWCIRQLATAILDGPQPAEKARFAFFRRLAQLFVAG
jgi:MinD-like ATPase involved in chromosome partitioning or flagellar assembly